jgi:hypothetical protein
VRRWGIDLQAMKMQDASEAAKMNPRKVVAGGLQVNRNDGEGDEVSVVYPVTTISKLFVCR